jgi:hypothetical protein
MPEPIRPWANGFEWDCWQERNCDRCSKNDACELQDAILIESAWDGVISEATAERVGYSGACFAVLGWPCRERTTLSVVVRTGEGHV